MNCKHCKKELEGKENHTTIRYIKKDWKGAYGYAGGGFEGEEEITIDAGVFCSDECLIDYLEENKEK